MQSISAHELWVAVHVHDPDRRQGYLTPERIQLGHHLVAQLAFLPVDHCKMGFTQ